MVVTDALDPGVNYVDAYLGGDENTKGSYDSASHKVTWSLGSQPAGESGTVVLKVEVNENATAAGVVANRLRSKSAQILR